MRRLGLLPLSLLLLALAGFRGTVPLLYSSPEEGISSVLIGCRVTLPTGETPTGSLALNLEGVKNTETYRLPIEPRRALLYQVEPGLYRLGPTRSIFGFHQDLLKVSVAGHSYKVPFPRDILRKEAIEVKPTRIVALGVVNVELLDHLPGRPATVRVWLDDSLQTRRGLVQAEIHAMMDPNAAAEERSAALAWTRALDEALSDLLTEAERRAPFRAVP